MVYNVYLGVDVGSVTVKIVVMESTKSTILHSLYIRTHGNPIQAIRQGLAEVKQSGDYTVLSAATTGSGLAECVDVIAPGAYNPIISFLPITAEIGKDEEIPLPQAIKSGLTP